MRISFLSALSILGLLGLLTSPALAASPVIARPIELPSLAKAVPVIVQLDAHALEEGHGTYLVVNSKTTAIPA